MSERINVEEIFGENLFTLGKMKERLPKKVYEEAKHVMEHGGELSLAAADVIAKVMKDWAVEKGATHYTHWFQPLTGTTAEKHDAFVTVPDENGKMIMEFSGKELIKGEPDASSFPSGGLRSTFEARGYTAWDITSPAFIKEAAVGHILCIPTAFCSYTGVALDKKTPLLRSMEAINTQALRIIRLFGNTTATKVEASVGAEQEYFLIDQKKALKRSDIIFTGRTLFGAPAPKGQEMDDHYFGVIRERIGSFMKDLNTELWKLGVTAKTQHNEAAPAQHELAPIYETVNNAVDHNQLVMESMKRIAGYHGMRCLLHEKPFAGISGSGKHNNWSLCTDTGINLLDPGATPNDNIQFLLILACVMKAVDTHADLLRQSASVVGNDLRLGASEAPPAIVSMFLGEQLEDVVKQLVETGVANDLKEGGYLATGVSTLPDFKKDATDRNRTSPFAFTGNKFEFRMVGSSDSVASPNTTMNAIVAEAFCEAADILEQAEDFDLAVHDLIKKYMTEHQRIIFNGNGYSKQWEEEAQQRGLSNLRSTADALSAYLNQKNIDLVTKRRIFSEEEFRARYDIHMESYRKLVNIEGRTAVDMILHQILPAALSYTKSLCEGVGIKKQIGASHDAESALITALSEKTDSLYKKCMTLQDTLNNIPDSLEESVSYCRDKIVTAMESIRADADALEQLTDKTYWPYPTYSDFLFY